MKAVVFGGNGRQQERPPWRRSRPYSAVISLILARLVVGDAVEPASVWTSMMGEKSRSVHGPPHVMSFHGVCQALTRVFSSRDGDFPP